MEACSRGLSGDILKRIATGEVTDIEHYSAMAQEARARMLADLDQATAALVAFGKQLFQAGLSPGLYSVCINSVMIAAGETRGVAQRQRVLTALETSWKRRRQDLVQAADTSFTVVVRVGVTDVYLPLTVKAEMPVAEVKVQIRKQLGSHAALTDFKPNQCHLYYKATLLRSHQTLHYCNISARDYAVLELRPRMRASAWDETDDDFSENSSPRLSAAGDDPVTDVDDVPSPHHQADLDASVQRFEEEQRAKEEALQQLRRCTQRLSLLPETEADVDRHKDASTPPASQPSLPSPSDPNSVSSTSLRQAKLALSLISPSHPEKLLAPSSCRPRALRVGRAILCFAPISPQSPHWLGFAKFALHRHSVPDRRLPPPPPQYLHLAVLQRQLGCV